MLYYTLMTKGDASEHVPQPVERGPMDVDPHTLTAIQNGEALPTFDALERFPQIFDAVIHYLKHAGKSQRQETRAIARHYLHISRGKQMEQTAVTRVVMKYLRRTGVLTALAGATVTIAVRKDFDVFAIMTFLALYISMKTIVPDSVRKLHRTQLRHYDDMKTRLMDALQLE